MKNTLSQSNTAPGQITLAFLAAIAKEPGKPKLYYSKLLRYNFTKHGGMHAIDRMAKAALEEILAAALSFDLSERDRDAIWRKHFPRK